MKKTVTGILLALTMCSAHAEFLSANDLLNKMNSPQPVDQGLALGYVMGIFDVMYGSVACPPDAVTAGQVYDMTKKFIIAMPEKRHLSADQFISFMLKNTWPCKKSSAPPTATPGTRML